MKLKVGPEMAGATNLGERGQVVIPKEVRDMLKLKVGEHFFVMVHNEAVILMPKRKMQAFIKKLTKQFGI